MSKTTSKGVQTLLRLILSILLAFCLLGTAMGAIGTLLTASPQLLLSQIHKQSAGEKAYATLESNFNTAYNTTAVPAEVYLDAISPEWLEEAMETVLTAAYTGDEVSLDFTALEDSITAYFSQYAEENNYEKDDTYEEKLAETISNGESTITSAADVYHTATLQKSGMWNKLFGKKTKLIALTVLCAVGTVLLLGVLLLLRRGSGYWIGTSAFASGVLLLAPSIWVLASGTISHFTLKTPAVYAICTGTMTAVVTITLWIGVVLAVLGMGLLVWNMIRERSNRVCNQLPQA